MEKKRRRFAMSFIGVVTSGISVGFFKLSVLGVDPFQVFMGGLNEVITINFGTLYVIVNAILLLFSLLTDRHYIGFGTFVNLFLLGYVVDFSTATLLALFPSTNLLGRLVSFGIGIFIISIGSAFYYVADLGVSTYDAISLIISNTWKIGEFRFVRIICDFICGLSGCILFLSTGSGITNLLALVGIGTFIIASSMGPLIDFFIRRVAQPFYDK